MSYVAISLTDVAFNSIFFVALLSKILPISIGLVIYLIINQLGIFSKTSS